MIKPFKFFKGYVYSDEYTFQDTPEGHMSRRMLYHTNRGQYDRLRHPNNEMERYFYDRNLRHDRLTEQRDLINTDNQRGFFQPITVTKINPKWWMKIKMGLQEMSIYFKSDPYGIMIMAGMLTIFVIIILCYILNA